MMTFTGFPHRTPDVKPTGTVRTVTSSAIDVLGARGLLSLTSTSSIAKKRQSMAGPCTQRRVAETRTSAHFPAEDTCCSTETRTAVAFDVQDRVQVLTYSFNLEYRGVCPICEHITLGENVVDSPAVGPATSRIYASCEACGWEGPG